MKKLLNLFVALLFLSAFVFAPVAHAANIADVTEGFWAKNEINEMVDTGVMGLDSRGNFNPLAFVERAEFTTMLIKVLNQSNLEIYIENPFSDITLNTPHYDNIMRSEQIGLVYGYPDGTFKPAKDIKKEEVASVMSHITKDSIYDLSFLDGFADVDAIPEWAKTAYAKTVKQNLYVNYPNADKFEPAKEITRAETAVLLSKLKAAMANAQKKAENVEKVLSTEHLSINSKAPANTVTVTNKRKIIDAGNILKVAFVEKFDAKKANTGDTVVLTNEKDIVTDEGTLLIPQGSKFYATVQDLVLPKKWNKSGAVKLHFDRLELANGGAVGMDAVAFNTDDGYLKKSSVKKLAGYTLAGTAVGAGVATAVGVPTDEMGTSLAISLPTGAALGFLTGLVTKGSAYKASKGDELYILLQDGMSIRESL